MKSNYDILGNHIRLVDRRNTNNVTNNVLGINIDKCFMPSVANVIGTDLSKYKLISKGLFACNPMHVGRDERLPVALYTEEEPAIVSPAYFMFEIKSTSVLNAEFLMMWFRRPEFDRDCWFKTDGSVRGGITWDDICRIELPIPPYESQLKIVESYNAITDRIVLKRKINDNFDARTKIHLQNYLRSREDDNPALFVSFAAPHNRLQINGIEKRLRNIGKQLGINKVHPHKFRRTLATMAIDKGMPIEQLQQLLGHKRIDTTLQYAMVKQNNVKIAHRKYIG